MTPRAPHLFGLDLDGTTLNAAGQVSPRTRAALHALLAAGHRVCFATGRNLHEARPVFEAAGHLDLAVLVNGAMTVDCKDDTTLHRGHMHADLARDLCTTIEDLGEAALAFQDRAEADVDYFVSRDRPVHPSQTLWFAVSGQIVVRPPSMRTIDHTRTLRVNCICGPAKAEQLRQAVETRFAGRVYVHSIVVAREAVEIVEVFDPSVNKWQGLTRVADQFGIAHDRIVTAGDDTNDLPMLRHAKLGLAMGNARAAVQHAAARVIGRNDEDGLAVFIEQWLTEVTAD